MNLNLQLSGWLQFNVHYYDRIKFKYGGDDEAIEISLEQLKEQAVESIPRELENFMFLNCLESNRQAVKSAVHQQSLFNIYEVVDSLTNQMIAEVMQSEPPEGREKYNEADIKKLIDEKRVHDWIPETVKKLLSGSISPSMKKADQSI